MTILAFVHELFLDSWFAPLAWLSLAIAIFGIADYIMTFKTTVGRVIASAVVIPSVVGGFSALIWGLA